MGKFVGLVVAAGLLGHAGFLASAVSFLGIAILELCLARVPGSVCVSL